MNVDADTFLSDTAERNLPRWVSDKHHLTFDHASLRVGAGAFEPVLDFISQENSVRGLVGSGEKVELKIRVLECRPAAPTVSAVASGGKAETEARAPLT